MDFLLFLLICGFVFFAALMIHFAKRRQEESMLSRFDQYRKTQYNPADYIKNYYNLNDYQSTGNLKHSDQSHVYESQFDEERRRMSGNKPQLQSMRNRILEQVAKSDPSLGCVIKQLQEANRR